MFFFVVYLDQMKLIVIKEDWIENPDLGSKSKIFFSPNSNEVANFALPLSFYFDDTKTTCYEAFVCKCFGKSLKLFHFVDGDLTMFLFTDTLNAAKQHIKKQEKILPQPVDFHQSTPRKARKTKISAPRIVETYDLTENDSESETDIPPAIDSPRAGTSNAVEVR